ncbi:MAG: glycosyltransferase [Bacilli bacterium]|nr:glycosyltransferase [Bacilli bacterium]
MHVCIVGRGLPNSKYSINGIFEYQQAINVKKYNSNLKITYLSLDFRSLFKRRHFGLKRFSENDITIYDYNFPLGGTPDKIFYHFALKKVLKVLKKLLLTDGEPDIIHTHFINNSYLIIKASEVLNLKSSVIATEHLSSIHNIDANSYLCKLAKYTYDRVNSLISVSPSLATAIKLNFGITSIYIPNMVNTESFKFKKEIKIFTNDSFRLVSVGTLVPNKRFGFLIELVNELSNKIKNISLTIIGEGPEYSKLKRQIMFCGLGNIVSLIGSKSQNEIADIFNESDLFVLLSDSETFGLVFVEAMVSGLPVVATKSGGPNTIISNSIGKLVPVNDFDSALNAIMEVYNNYSYYDPEKISNLALSKFSPETVVSEIVKVYEKSIKR